MLTVEGLTAFYGRAQILHGIALEVGAGEVAALLGRNGAGKTTTLKAIMGLLQPAAGTVRFEGRAIQGLPAFRIARLGLGYVPEERRIFTDLTVLENLMAGQRAAPPGSSPWTVERLFALFPNLAELRHRPGGQISGGEQQMLTIARTLIGNPRLILLDEPSEGLAPVVVARLAEALAALRGQGVALLLSEQNLRFCAGLAERAYVLESGRLGYAGPMTGLMADESVRRALLAV